MTYRLRASAWPRWIGSIASDDPTDDRPFLLPGVRVQCGKITRPMKRRAQAEAAKLLPAAESDGSPLDPLDAADAGDAYTASIIRQGIIAWAGIGDADGKVLAVSPEAIELFIDDEDLFRAADREYVTPNVLADVEKNGLSASPNGIGAAATQASDTATLSARPTKSGDASPTKKRAKKDALTS